MRIPSRLVPIGLGAGLVLLACGGSNGSLFTAPLDDAGSSGSSGTSGTSGSGASSGTSGTGASSGASGTGASSGTSGTGNRDDGGTRRDAAPVDAGPPPLNDGAASNPAVVVCGATTCAVGTLACCTNENGQPSCVSPTNECKNGTLLRCDETADCPATEVCCLSRQNETLVGACSATCTGSQTAQACQTQAECLTGSCALHTCTNVGGGGGGGGTIVSMCGPLQGICP